MKRKDKFTIIEKLTEQINSSSHFYLTDIATLNAADTSKLRRECFSKNIKLLVVKNTLLKKAFEKSDKKLNDLYDVLKDSTSIMFAETGNAPAKLIKEFRRESNCPKLRQHMLKNRSILATISWMHWQTSNLKKSYLEMLSSCYNPQSAMLSLLYNQEELLLQESLKH
jgi:ribosomal protein L10